MKNVAKGMRRLMGGIVLLLLFESALSVTPEEFDTFKQLWQTINDLISPQWDAWRSDAIPKEVFMMEAPGFAIDPDEFDPLVWKFDRYRGLSPDYNKHQLTDIVPSYSNQFVDTGARISRLWEHFVYNARSESPRLDPARESRYQEAIARLYEDDWTLKPLDSQRDALLDDYAAALDSVVDDRYQCLQRHQLDPSICSRKAVVWKEKLGSKWYAYETMNQDVLGTQSEIMALQRNDLSVTLSKALQTFAYYKRNEVGQEGFLNDYWTVEMTPSNWWTWWRQCGQNATEDRTHVTEEDCEERERAFVDVSMTLARFYEERQKTFDRLFSEVPEGVSFARPLIRVDSTDATLGVTPGYHELYSAVDGAADIHFEMAKVKIHRPWMDLGLLRYAPIAVTGLLEGAWATGDLSEQDLFPLLPTSMVVARNIRISSATWSSEVKEALTAATTNCDAPIFPTDGIGTFPKDLEYSYECNGPTPLVSVGIGPFTTGVQNTKYSRTFSRNTDGAFDGTTLRLKGPVIIGWVGTPVPRFPTANVDDLASSTRNSTAPAVM